MTQTLTLIVPFEVPEESNDQFRQQWHTTAGRLSRAPGFLSARLYEVDREVEAYLQQRPGFQWLRERQPRFLFYNIAEWASLSDYEAALSIDLQQPPISFPCYPAYYRTGDASYTRPAELRGKQTFSLIAPFEVPREQDDVLRQQWRDIVTNMVKTGGARVEGSYGPGLYEIDSQAEERLQSFLSTRLQREGPTAEPRFRFINVAEWESLPHYEAATHNSSRVKPISFPSYPAYYRIVAEYSGKDI